MRTCSTFLCVLLWGDERYIFLEQYENSEVFSYICNRAAASHHCFKMLSSLCLITSNNRAFTTSRGILIHGHTIPMVDQLVFVLPHWMRKQSFLGVDFSSFLIGMEKYRFTNSEFKKTPQPVIMRP